MGNITQKISRAGLILVLIGAALLWTSLGDTIISFKEARSFEDVLEAGAAPGDHIAGQVPFLLDTFASMETWTENSRTHTTTSKRTSFRYYVLPGGEGYLGLSVGSSSFSTASSLVKQTYAYLSGGDEPTAELTVDARVVVMKEELAQLFREDMRDYYGYTDQDIEAMGTPLLVEPRAFETIRVFCAVGAALALVGAAVLVIHWRKVSGQLRRAREAAPGPDLD